MTRNLKSHTREHAHWSGTPSTTCTQKSELTTSDTVANKTFSQERAFANTLHSYRNAVLAFLRNLKLQNLARRYSGEPQVAPKKHLAQILNKLGHNTPEGAKLTSNLEQLIHRADGRWEERQRQQTG